MPAKMSGRRFAPKISTTINRMTTSSGRPIRPMTDTPWTGLWAGTTSGKFRKKMTLRLYHQQSGAAGQLPLPRGQKPPPQAAVWLDACDQVAKDLADATAFPQSPHEGPRKVA